MLGLNIKAFQQNIETNIAFALGFSGAKPIKKFRSKFSLNFE